MARNLQNRGQHLSSNRVKLEAGQESWRQTFNFT